MKLEQGIAFASMGPGSGPQPAGQESFGHDSASRYQRWQHAMEQAELAGWFKGTGDEQAHEGHATQHGAVKTASFVHAGTRERARLSPSQGEAFSRYAGNAMLGYGGAQGAAQQDTEPKTTTVAGPSPAAGAYAAESGIGRGMAALDSTASTASSQGGLPGPLIAQLRAAMAASASGMVDTGAVMAAQVETAAAPEDVSHSLDETEPSLPSAKQKPAASGEPDPAVRIHAEWTGQGVRIWLGIRHDESAVLPEVRRQLDRLLAESGHPLLSLVCNGRRVVGTAQGEPAKRTQSARWHEGQYRQVLQEGERSGQPMFHPYQQVAR
ncbi:hypothetical protein ACNRBS_04290 [Ralstonia pseudosolanacearum]|nr:hypothetical protein [Ralstonia pseudosolanacearum]MCF1441341.1 hypothetical protein [Ralstonia solanacearum]BCL94196.1 hypothetical protein MAFF211479_38970 [Ralstonia solanacearum]BCL99346.1 hypothetical protein MAFF211491_37980 [Ralstonia solanacearum]BCM14823.1 hypothetical protein MAFF241648_40130 [Ralstonia solanacearum]BCN06762.1 hypothetical protein RPSB_38990 [Ralstonia solanacearum]